MYVGNTLVKRCATVVAGALVALGASAAVAGSASAAPSNGVCNGGSVLGGTYLSLTINGTCEVDSGTVNVAGSVNVKPGAFLVAAWGGSDLHVKGNVTVGADASLVLGCGPSFPCFNDPDPQNPTLMTHHSIGGKVNAGGTTGAADMVLHNNNIKGDLKYTNGGSGATCGNFAPVNQPIAPPGFSTFEDNNFGGAVTITKISTCWMGFIRNNVVGTVIYNNNTTADGDGNEIVGNQIGGDLRCQGNAPPPQGGDAPQLPNLVAGVRTGQCQSTSLP